MALKLHEILEATGGRLMRPGKDSFTGVSTDTRTISRGELFVPLSGPNFDGHEFIEAAMKAGAAGSLVSAGRADAYSGKGTVVEVGDTLAGLQNIASFVRRKYAATPLIGVTGSNGKTTTKEMVHSILSVRGPALKNTGNLNNEIGMPLTLCKLTAEHLAAVLEMGMSAPGEIAKLTEIAVPDVGIITNVGAAHLESMGSVEAVAKAKGELVDGLPPHGKAVLNMDDRMLKPVIENCRCDVVTFGIGADAMFFAHSISDKQDGVVFVMSSPAGEVEVMLPVLGLHNVSNALAAAGAAWSTGMGLDEIKKGLESFAPASMRMEYAELGGIKVINDAYNANPASMAAALNTLANIRGCRRVAALGDMLELGESSVDSHYNVGRLAGAAGLAMLVLVGPHAEDTARGASDSGMQDRDIVIARGPEEAADVLASRASTGDCILVKGSRGMRMEIVVQRLRVMRGAA